MTTNQIDAETEALIARLPNVPLGYLQYYHAWKLARGYGHEWAQYWNRGDLPKTVRDIARRTFTQRCMSPGIPYPNLVNYDDSDDSVVPDWDIVHVTTSGRTRWEIGSSGTVYLSIVRPHNEIVLRANVALDYTVSVFAVGRPYFVRHVYALATAVAILFVLDPQPFNSALALPIPVSRVFAPIWQGAQPDPEPDALITADNGTVLGTLAYHDQDTAAPDERAPDDDASAECSER